MGLESERGRGIRPRQPPLVPALGPPLVPLGRRRPVSVFCLWGKEGKIRAGARNAPRRASPDPSPPPAPVHGRPENFRRPPRRPSPGEGSRAAKPPGFGKKGCQKNAAFWSQAAAGMRGEIEMEGGWTPPLPVPRHCLVARPLWEGADALSLTCGPPKVAWEVTGWPKK